MEILARCRECGSAVHVPFSALAAQSEQEYVALTCGICAAKVAAKVDAQTVAILTGFSLPPEPKETP